MNLRLICRKRNHSYVEYTYKKVYLRCRKINNIPLCRYTHTSIYGMGISRVTKKNQDDLIQKAQITWNR